MDTNRLERLSQKGFDRWRILYEYSTLDLNQLIQEARLDHLCLKEFIEKNDNPYADDACEFLQKFRFFIQGDGHPFPTDFSDENRNGILLSDEMRRIYCEARDRSNKV